MKMHSGKFKDPLISRAQPVAIVLRLVEEGLRSAGVSADRSEILERFMSGQPRLAVVHGGDDHPAGIGMKSTIRRLLRAIWLADALPFVVAQSMPCEELAHGSDAANYGLLSRNHCAASVASQMEAHGYDGAVIVGACDRMLTGNLRGLVETDLARQRRKSRPLFAMVLPSLVGRDVFIAAEDRYRFEPLRERLPEQERNELDDLLRRPLNPALYVRIKLLLDRSQRNHRIQDAEKDALERYLACSVEITGSYGASSEESVVHRLVIASLGLVPRHCEFPNKPVSDSQLLEAMRRLVAAIVNRERKVSAAGLLRSNLSNAISVWIASGGHPSWILHLTYLADAIGRKLTAADMVRRARAVPRIVGIADARGASLYAMSVEAENGGNSGIDTVMRTLSEKRWVEDRAVTLDGSWAHRITEARSANGVFLHSTMTPVAKTCGLSGIQGNICKGGVVRRNGAAGFDRQIFLAVVYLGTQQLQADLKNTDGLLQRLRARVTREDLYDTWKLNWAADSSHTHIDWRDAAHWSKAHLWSYLEERRLLRMMLVVAGVGPHASGMPELQFDGNTSAVLTDGRVSWSHEGISIAQLVPEAFDGGAIAAIRTGDWIRLDLTSNEIHLVGRNGRNGRVKVFAPREILNRPDRKRRISELARQRLTLLPSFRTLLDTVSAADSGVSPCPRA